MSYFLSPGGQVPWVILHPKHAPHATLHYSVCSVCQ